MTDETDVSDREFVELMTPLTQKIAAEMRKEPGSRILSDQFLYALAARAAVAAGAYMGDPRSIVRSTEQRVCPGCGTRYRRSADGWSCLHTAGCGWRENGP